LYEDYFDIKGSPLNVQKNYSNDVENGLVKRYYTIDKIIYLAEEYVANGNDGYGTSFEKYYTSFYPNGNKKIVCYTDTTSVCRYTSINNYLYREVFGILYYTVLYHRGVAIGRGDEG
jgi:hypothetical protein